MAECMIRLLEHKYSISSMKKNGGFFVILIDFFMRIDETAISTEQRSCSKKSIEKEGKAKSLYCSPFFSVLIDESHIVKLVTTKVCSVSLGLCSTIRRKSVKVIAVRARTRKG